MKQLGKSARQQVVLAGDVVKTTIGAVAHLDVKDGDTVKPTAVATNVLAGQLDSHIYS